MVTTTFAQIRSPLARVGRLPSVVTDKKIFALRNVVGAPRFNGRPVFGRHVVLSERCAVDEDDSVLGLDSVSRQADDLFDVFRGSRNTTISTAVNPFDGAARRRAVGQRRRHRIALESIVGVPQPEIETMAHSAATQAHRALEMTARPEVSPLPISPPQATLTPAHFRNVPRHRLGEREVVAGARSGSIGNDQ